MLNTSRKVLVIALAAPILTVSLSANTTYLDAHYFAFRPSPIFAVRDRGTGQWSRVSNFASMGLNGGQFVLDARAGNSLIPIPCRQRFTSTFDESSRAFSLPKELWLGQYEVQQQYMFGIKCSVRIWISGQSYQGFDRDLNRLVPRPDRSVSVGIIEFSSGNATSAISFSVQVVDAR